MYFAKPRGAGPASHQGTQTVRSKQVKCIGCQVATSTKEKLGKECRVWGRDGAALNGAGLTEEGSLEQSLRKGCVCVSPLLHVGVSAHLPVSFVFQILQYLSYDLH